MISKTAKTINVFMLVHIYPWLKTWISSKSFSVVNYFNSFFILLKRHAFIFTVIILLMFCSGCSKNNSSLIILSNDKIEVGILPDLGGRIVLLRKPGFKNILKSDESIWANPQNHKPEISAFSDFVAFNGHITWVGPQSEWWINQTLNEERRKSKADWPPDPYLIYGKNEIISKSDTFLKMVGLASPVSGVRLYKEISINSTGIVTVTTTAENIRDENISLDLWMLTRLYGFANAYVPIEENGILELLKKDNETIEATPHQIIDNHFTYNPSMPTKPKKEQVQEVHLNPSAGYISGFYQDQMLLIRFEKREQNLIHPKHGLVELYSYVSDNNNESLLELEVHGSYKTLAPGESMSLTEKWEVYTYSGNTNPKDQIKFLEMIVKK